MEQGHLESKQVVAHVVAALLEQVVADRRGDRDDDRREGSALDARLEPNDRSDAGQFPEARAIREVVLTPPSADRVPSLFQPGERGMLRDRLAELLEDRVHLVLPWLRHERLGVDEQVDVFREAADQVPALGEARAAFEHRLVSELPRDDAQDLGDVVVLLDELLADLELFGGAEHRLLELRVLEELHFACHSRA